MSRLAVVGAGPWGTYALERLAARASQLARAGVTHIAVFEATGNFGDGRIHHAGQVTTSALNRVASQIGFAADEAIVGAPLLPTALRPTLAQWAGERHRRHHDPRYATQPTEIPARALHGEALQDAFARYASCLEEEGVAVELIDCALTGIHPDDDGVLLRYTEAGSFRSCRAAAVLLTTGHGTGTNEDGPVRSRGPYPLATMVTEASVPPGSSVALAGAGLTAVDVILHLTEGRGGRFTAGIGARYVPSGREPARLLPVSPSGLLPAARPFNEKAAEATGRGHASLELRPRWFTISAVEELALRRQDRLDFDRDILPLVVAEMALTYYRTFAGDAYTAMLARHCDSLLARGVPTPTGAAAASVHRAFAELWQQPEVRERVATILGELPRPSWLPDAVTDPDDLRFDWEMLASPLMSRQVAPEHWADEALVHLRWDVACARQGNLGNPWKAAWDGVWRDLRPVLSRVLDFDLLSSESKNRFLGTHWRTYARQVNGAGPEAAEKLLALAEAGILDLGAGPGARILQTGDGQGGRIRRASGRTTTVDVVIPARVPRLDPASEPPYAQLLSDGHLTVTGEPGVLNLSQEFHPIARDGHEDARITILGPPAEGLVFFQMALARPQSASSVMRTVEGWAAGLLNVLEGAPLTR